VSEEKLKCAKRVRTIFLSQDRHASLTEYDDGSMLLRLCDRGSESRPPYPLQCPLEESDLGLLRSLFEVPAPAGDGVTDDTEVVREVTSPSRSSVFLCTTCGQSLTTLARPRDSSEIVGRSHGWIRLRKLRRNRKLSLKAHPGPA